MCHPVVCAICMGTTTSRGQMAARSVSAPQQGEGEFGRNKAESLMASHPDLCSFCIISNHPHLLLLMGFLIPKWLTIIRSQISPERMINKCTHPNIFKVSLHTTFQKLNSLYKIKMLLLNSSIVLYGNFHREMLLGSSWLCESCD